MDLHSPAPSSSASASASSDNGYALGDEPPAPARALTTVAAPPEPADENHGATVLPSPAEETEPAPTPADAPAPAGEKPRDRAGEAPRTVSLRRRKRRASRRHLVPAWVVSMLVHVGILVTLAAFTFRVDARKLIANINTALVPTMKGAEREETPIYADPSALGRSESAMGSETSPSGGGSEGGGGGSGFGGIGTGPPSATPVVAGVGRGVGEKTSLPGVKVSANLSDLALLPTAPGVDLGGGGLIAGDVAFQANGVGPALDQIAHEILRHLGQHKLTVLWMFDESGSMKDDQKAIKEKFERIVADLKTHADPEKKISDPLTHAVIGFGQDLHYDLEKPTANAEGIGKAIEHLKVDDTGTENTLHAITEVVDHYASLIRKDRRLMIVLVTDESGDDGPYIEEAHQAVVSRKVPVYVIGRQALFGYGTAHLKYIDPVTKDVYWPEIRRGPESADIECLQWDGLHERREEQPSGFGPYELARLAQDTGGIYFLLPSEEGMRVRQREQTYSIADLKEYRPDYSHRQAYTAARQKSDLRRTLHDIIVRTRDYGYPNLFPVVPAEFVPKAGEAVTLATERLNDLLDVQKVLESLAKQREREPDKRWQAHYDLMLAQIVTYQIKSYEYRACLEEMAKNPPRPKEMPTPDRDVRWEIVHSGDRRAPKERTEKKYQEATRLLKEVIARHPKTPWADLAQDELNRGFGVAYREWRHNPKYEERARLVPKY